MTSSHFDFIIIGGGQAGIPLSHTLAGAGKKVALIESQHLGGSCINFGCTPTKDVIASAKLAHDARRGADFGLEISSVRVRFDEVIRQARAIVAEMKGDLEKGFQDQKNLTLIGGRAKLDGRDEQGNFRILVGESLYTAKKVVLDTGTRSFIPKVEGLDPSHVLTSENWLELSELPKKIAFLGSGYIGVEMGQFYRRMGSEIVLIEGGPRILSREDTDVSEALLGFLRSEGMDFRLNTHLKKVEGRPGAYRLTLDSGTLDATHIYVATGRKPNSDDLGLESLGIRTAPKGFVQCDSRLATNVEGIWVAGDLRGGPMFTHTSWDDFRILRSQFLEDGSRTTDRIVPYAVFTDPELGRVGATEREAHTQDPGRELVVSRFNFSESSKAIEIREARGFIKIVADAKTEEILGAAVLGASGSELIHIYGTLMQARAPYSVIHDQIMIHPTLAEAIQSAVYELPAKRYPVSLKGKAAS